MSDRELFRMNEHGDVWSEPDLFEQGGENVTTSVAGELLAATAADRYPCPFGESDCTDPSHQEIARIQRESRAREKGNRA